ncbi:MAG: hypothetical protein J6W54_05450 [Fibrobacter sp.]|uniref:hypothetical protein n=1 Tax=Fibrobacter sp. TaxID=35828 RepID=UPI001B05F508|nr:hypothetical protein [Fibrobacter sp.]MBO7060527.1 hypothetical protein [Fibrobacter sp.]
MSLQQVFGNNFNKSQPNGLNESQNQCRDDIEKILDKFDKIKSFIDENIHNPSKNTDPSKNSALSDALISAYNDLTDLIDSTLGRQDRSVKSIHKLQSELPNDLRGVPFIWEKIDAELDVVKKKIDDAVLWNRINFYLLKDKLEKIMTDIHDANLEYVY